MQYKEFGKDRNQTIVLLHGGGLSWWNYREAALLLQSDYHVLLPILDGHAGSDRPFTTIADNAAGILDFIQCRCGGQVLLIGGLSLGGQIVLEILSQNSGVCPYAIVESAAVIPSGITNALIAPAFGSSYGLIQNKSFAKLQFASLHMKPDLFEAYYTDTCRIRKSDMIAFMKASTSYSLSDAVADTTAEVHVFAGEKENRGILRSADAVCRAIPGCRKTILPGLHHGEFSLNHPQEYARTIRNILHG